MFKPIERTFGGHIQFFINQLLDLNFTALILLFCTHINQMSIYFGYKVFDGWINWSNWRQMELMDININHQFNGIENQPFYLKQIQIEILKHYWTKTYPTLSLSILKFYIVKNTINDKIKLSFAQSGFECQFWGIQQLRSVRWNPGGTYLLISLLDSQKKKKLPYVQPLSRKIRNALEFGLL